MVIEPGTSEIPSFPAHSPRAPAGHRVLLVTSAAPAQSPFSTKEKRPPLGIGFLIAVLRNAGHRVLFLDNYLQPNDFLETDYLREHAVDFVGIYANTICFRDTLRMVRRLHELRCTRRWQGRILVGGPHAAVAPQTIPDSVDHIVQGEGEQAILDIVAGKVTERLIRYPRIEDLDALPRPAWDCFAGLPYNWDTCFLDETPVFTMNTSRGCPFQCAFCSVGSVWGKRYTYFSAERIVSDIEHLVRNYGARGIYFREDNFTLHEGRLRRFCQLMIEKGIGVPWVCESRVSTLTRERVALMARAGARGMYFGVESGAPRMLELLGKGITVEQTENAFRWCREFGIKTAASVVVGVPGETAADLSATRDLLHRIQPTITWPNVFVGIPDSRLYRCVLESNAYEYIDDRGLVYLPGHNEKVRRYYGGSWNAGIPDTEAAKDETNRPKVSVLLCVHNGERFIRAALASIYGQTYQDFEVVIVDDGSTDGTPEILRQMKDSRTVIYRNAENQGLTKSLNTGLRLCRGAYVARMDADDLSHPRRLEKQAPFLDGNPDCCVVGSWCHWLDAEGRVTGSWEPPTEAKAVRHRLLVRNCLAHGSILIRRAVLEQAGGYDEAYPYAQDYDLWLRLSESGQIRNLGEHLYSVRCWEGAISQSKSELQRQYADAALLAAQRRCRQPCAVAGATWHGIPASVQVSVVLTTYNRPQLLTKVLEGFAIQTAAHDDFEVIVVDDGSVPPVREIAEPFAGRMRLKYLRQDNAGLAAARNAGIQAAEGCVVLFSDDDDVPAPELIAEHWRSHRAYPDERVVVLGHLDWHPDLQVTPLMHYVTHVGGEYFGFDRLQDGQFYDRWKWWGGLVSVKRSLLQNLDGPFDTRLRFGYEDTELVCRLADRQIRVLYNAHARSYVLKSVTFEGFCRRSYKQGKALHRVAAAHPQTIVARYHLENAASEYWGKYAENLDGWMQKIGKFEMLLAGKHHTPGCDADRHLQMLYGAYRECFRGHVLRGYVEQFEAAERGAVLLSDSVNGEDPSSLPESTLTLRSVRAQAAARRHRVRRDRPAPDFAAARAVSPLRIAFVDTNTPCFDVGSSSLRIHRIVKILVAQGHRIDYLHMNHHPSDQRYKAAFEGAVQFIKATPTVNSFRDYLLCHGGGDPDVVWITNLWALDYTSFALQLTQWLRKNRPQIKVIVDTMDLHYKKFLRRFRLSGRPQEREMAERFLELERKLYPLANRVLAVTEVEKRDILAHAGPCRVEVVPNIHPVRPQSPDIRRRRHMCFLGAFRIAHNLDAVHWFLREVQPHILRNAPDVQFHILGHGNEAFRETLEAYPNVKVVGYVEDAEQAVAQYRLFVCPMIYGAGMKGKLGTAAAAGTPFVTTTIGAEGFGLVNGRHCFIADRPEEFAARCLDLLYDDELWDRFRVNATDLLRSRFSVETVGQRIDRLLASLAAGRSCDDAFVHGEGIRAYERMPGADNRERRVQLDLQRTGRATG
jgi:glycosyltransferase involved in cell wall biosynthesis/radical SAM superfamily enzyme YgiQ (UPF0313 family)